MDSKQLTKHMQEALDHTKDVSKKFSKLNSNTKNIEVLTEFTDGILRVFDYSFNDYPGHDINSYYPRPNYHDTKSMYAKKIEDTKKKKDYEKKKIKIDDHLYDFLMYVFRMNANNNRAISLLQGSMKHKIGKNAEAICETDLEYSLSTTGNRDPVQKNKNGSVDIAGAIHIEKGGTLKISNSGIMTPDGLINVEHLVVQPIRNGRFRMGDKEINPVQWMKDCIFICKKMIQKIRNEHV